MQIRVRAADKNQAARLANAIKRSYFKAIVAAEKELRTEELAKFEERAEQGRERLKPKLARLDELKGAMKEDSIYKEIETTQERLTEIRKNVSDLSLEVHKLSFRIEIAKNPIAESADKKPTDKEVEKLEEQHKFLHSERNDLVALYEEQAAGLKKLKERRDEMEVLELTVAYYRSAVNTLDEEIAKRRDDMRCTPTVEDGKDAPLTAE